jgi:protein SCO1/2
MKEGDAKVAAEAQATKRYPLTGRVVSIDKPTQSINVDGDKIPGFMAAMTMPYQVKDASLLDKLTPEDQIKAEIVVGDKGAYLENVTVVAKTAAQAPNK